MKYIYTFDPMDTQMTHEEAWNDFFDWIKTQQKWSEIPRKRKQYFYVVRSALKAGKNPNHWIESILNEYAPGRYIFVVIKKT